jgi:plasmid stabilization system protein ParE
MDFDIWEVETYKEARRDIAVLFSYIAEVTGNARYAGRFKFAVEDALKSLSTFPNTHPQYEDFGENVRRLNLPKHKVAIVYKTYEEERKVVAVLVFHTSQDPESYKRAVAKRLVRLDP